MDAPSVVMFEARLDGALIVTFPGGNCGHDLSPVLVSGGSSKSCKLTAYSVSSVCGE